MGGQVHVVPQKELILVCSTVPYGFWRVSVSGNCETFRVSLPNLRFQSFCNGSLENCFLGPEKMIITRENMGCITSHFCLLLNTIILVPLRSV